MIKCIETREYPDLNSENDAFCQSFAWKVISWCVCFFFFFFFFFFVVFFSASSNIALINNTHPFSPDGHVNIKISACAFIRIFIVLPVLQLHFHFSDIVAWQTRGVILTNNKNNGGKNLIQNSGCFLNQGSGIQCFLKCKVDLKLRTERLAYENVHLEITEIITISCIL